MKRPVAVPRGGVWLEELLPGVELKRLRRLFLAGDVRCGASRDKHGTGCQRDRAAVLPVLPSLPFLSRLPFPLEDHGAHGAALIGNRFDRVEVLGEADTFF